ncbi:MAG: BLUF domain-containing protein [Pseudomonadota bacterium]
MKCIIYTSNALQHFVPSTLQALAEDAAKRNETTSITGYLFFQCDKFFQYIEGDETAIDKLMNSIRKDTRHQVIRHFTDNTLKQRRFPYWSMALDYSKEPNYVRIESLLIKHLMMANQSYDDIEAWAHCIWQQVNKLAMLYRINMIESQDKSHVTSSQIVHDESLK